MKTILLPVRLSALLGATLLIAAPMWRAGAADCAKTSVGLAPLSDLGTGMYQGYQGGLYPNGSNTRPAAHESAGTAQARAVQPLNANGQLDANGRVVLISIGMSNTTQEFSTFKPMADADPGKNPKLVIVDGAQGGMTASEISNPNSPQGQQFWNVVNQRLVAANVTPAQVQIAWVKEANANPNTAFPAHALALRDQYALIAQILKTRFPNIRLAYYSSRTYGGYASTTLNPEPYAYESGFAVKWLIENQINGSDDLNFDPARGAVRTPWLAWGPYLWADGTRPRSDGLTYVCSDFANDGTHPAPGGARQKVAQLLLDFFKTDSTARLWFLASPSTGGSHTSVSAASFSGAALAAEAIVASFGSNLATAMQVATTTPLPTTLSGTTVKARDSASVEQLAPLFFVSPTQVNYQIPAGTANGAATITITSGDGSVSTGTTLISTVAPGLFTANASGQGVAAALALRIKADGSQSYEPVAQFDSAQSRFVAAPIDLGAEGDQVFLILFATGVRYRSALSAVTARIGGVDAQVIFAGAQGGFVGLDQVNVRLPRSLIGRGLVDVALTVDGQMA
ncbi:MAG: hypothetical protein MOB07_23540, partial [Acidobacteria bacterium]|nr:hypothetical protein [Acidobacteriota bacterium]